MAIVYKNKFKVPISLTPYQPDLLNPFCQTSLAGIPIPFVRILALFKYKAHK